MKTSSYKSYDDLPLFLNAEIGVPGKTQHSGFAGERRSNGTSETSRLWLGEGCGVCDDEAHVLGVSISTAYELMHEQSFSVLRVGSRMVVGREQFLRWTEERSGGAQ